MASSPSSRSHATILFGDLLVFGIAFLKSWQEPVLPAPHVTYPNSHERVRFSFNYPRNWAFDHENKDLHPDHFIVIRPPYADCRVALYIGGESDDAQEILANYVKTFEADWGVEAWVDKNMWGWQKGLGKTGVGTPPGCPPYDVTLFAVKDGDRVLAVWETCLASQRERMWPGIRLIRNSFRWR